MRNKGAILFLTILITAICVFYLSFSWKKMNIESALTEKVKVEYQDSLSAYPKAFETTEAKSELRKRIRRKHQAIIERTESYLGFNYKKIDEYSLNLGLDLRGGMNATLVVSPVEFVQAVANENRNNPPFVKALKEAKTRKRTDNRKFSEIFSEVWLESNDKEKLLPYFLSQNSDNGFDAFTKYEEVIDYIDETFARGLDKAIEVLRSRIDEFGTTQPIITPDYNAGRIEVELPGADDEKRIRKKLNSVAELEFCEVWELDYDSEMSKFMTDLQDYLKTEQDLEKTTSSVVEKDSLASEDITSEDLTEDLVDTNQTETADTDLFGDSEETGDSTAAAAQDKSPFAKYFNITGTQTSNKTYQRTYRAVNKDAVKLLFERKAVKKLMPANMTVLWDRGRNAEGEVDTAKSSIFYFIKKGPGYEVPLTGSSVRTASQQFGESSKPEISMQMTPSGATKWRKLTGDNIGQRVAVILDNKVYSAPNVMGEIPNGSSSISGDYSIEEAQDLANILRSGQLPSPTEIEKMVFVGPTLGQEAIERGLISLGCGLGLVILFMIAYYNKGGMVANIALLFNILFILGVLSVPNLGATLTLPGIAGIVLTIGMAIDANVLIFERIREELRSGKTMNNAVTIGYQKAFWTIVDSNVTTLITAILLASAGTGLVKGFGITLIIGICCSFFSSVYITRLFVEAMVKNKDKPRISFTTALSKKLFQNSNFAIIKNRKKAYLFSLVVIITGVSIMATSGLNLGVEFKGGRSYVVKFNEDISSSEVKSKLQDQFDGTGMIVKTYNGNNRLRITTSYLKDTTAKTEVVDTIVRKRLEAGLDAYYKDKEPIIEEYQSTGPTMAYEIRIQAVKSMVYALIAIFLYILLRFNKWQFSVGAIFALFHDVMFVLSMFAIVGLMGITYEIDEVFVAAILTIIGYSINDTVVVFDRVREFLRLNPKTRLADTLNKSINSTLSRTLMTSLTTLLVVIILFAFGGEALRGFSFALLVGVIVGTYSSIFIATPIVLDTTSAGKDGKVLFEEKKAVPSDDQTV